MESVLMTGASSDLGRLLVEALARQGVQLLAHLGMPELGAEP